jgi:hypothetical protein
MASTVISLNKHNELIDQGYSVLSKGNIFIHGSVYTKVSYKKHHIQGVFEKFCYAFSTDPQGLLYNKDLTNKYNKMDYERLGFNPFEPKSLEEYIQKNERHLVSCCGHDFIPFFKPISGSSCFIFIPNGNREEAYIEKGWNKKTGSPHLSGELIKNAMQYCSEYSPNERRDGYLKTIYSRDVGPISVITAVVTQKVFSH